MVCGAREGGWGEVVREGWAGTEGCRGGEGGAHPGAVQEAQRELPPLAGLPLANAHAKRHRALKNRGAAVKLSGGIHEVISRALEKALA